MQQTPLKIKGNLRDSKANYQQTQVHWLREITKAKLGRVKLSQVEHDKTKMKH